ncbi:phosphatidylinositol 4,5-bisphosphate-binding protein [Vermiconidia calcicola]|uniref:Phosphatidylinositol 4,5-bisphosphate-binding protein n=1 Tax=Vermiconidia calcicola TaxID=1690605 RepID=A0ACC3NPD1_9PEZI|nr:phosphatidylinositol 4,5-bisphosphate-binding protein [Vermiconidia calcicola]
MSSRPNSTYGAGYGSVPAPNDAHLSRGYGTNPTTSAVDYGSTNAASPISQSMSSPQGLSGGAFHEDFDASRPGSVIHNDGSGGADRATSTATTAVPASAPSRSNTLKKKSSVRRTGSLKRSSSRKSMNAGSVAGREHGHADTSKEYNSAFSTPVPTHGAPTEVLANRFQAWRQLLKSLITYFREIQTSYDARAKATHKVQSSIAQITHPGILTGEHEHGLGAATRILDDFHKHSIAEANKSRDIEADVIGALTGLRSDLGQKIKEIRSLSGDFKNSVEKAKDATRLEVDKLGDALQHVTHEDGSAVGKNDPFVVKLGVDRAIERQIDEENYLHRAYLNLESSGRELESIVVGEIQKAYNAIAGILKREGDDALHTVDSLRTGPIAMPKDAEWMKFVQHDPHFVDPNLPLRRIEHIDYPGKHHPAAAEVRSGMLERKSKYLKSYTPGWYVLSPTHLHEFKSADKIYSQPPVMSLYLPDQKLGSHSQQDSSSHKFMLKGKQSGGMHSGHNWVFRAETYDTMMAWFGDVRALTEKTGEERIAYVRKHARSFSGTSDRASSDGLDEDEADEVPYSADVASLADGSQGQEQRLQRPAPGGRFPSDLQASRNRGASMGQSSSSSDGRDVGASAGGLPASTQEEYQRNGQDPYRLDGVRAGTPSEYRYTAGSGVEGSYSDETPSPEQQRVAFAQPPPQQENYSQQPREMVAEPVTPQKTVPERTREIFAEQTPPQTTYPEQRGAVPEPVHQQQAFLGNEPVTQQNNYPEQPRKMVAEPISRQTTSAEQDGAVAQPVHQQQTFLGNEPVDQPFDRPAEDRNYYGDRAVPIAAGVAGVGATAAVVGASRQRDQETNVQQVEEAKPDVPPKSELRNDHGVVDNAPATGVYQPITESRDVGSDFAPDNRFVVEPIPTSAPVDSPGTFRNSFHPDTTSVAMQEYNTNPSSDVRPGTTTAATPISTTAGRGALGGLEREGAHETGAIFPTILRHNTDMSISQLHVPGEYPKQV